MQYNKTSLDKAIQTVHAVHEYYTDSYFLGREVINSLGKVSGKLNPRASYAQAQKFNSEVEVCDPESYEIEVKNFLGKIKSEKKLEGNLEVFPNHLLSDAIGLLSKENNDADGLETIKWILNLFSKQINDWHDVYCNGENGSIKEFIELGESYEVALLNAARFLERCPWASFKDNLGAFFNPNYSTEYILMLLKPISSIPHEGIKSFLSEKLVAYITLVKFNALARTVMNGFHALFALSMMNTFANSYQLLSKAFLTVAVATGIRYYASAKSIEEYEGITNFIINRILPAVYVVSIAGAFIA